MKIQGRIIVYHHNTDPNPPSEKNVHRQLHLTEHLPFPEGGYFWLLNEDFVRTWNPMQISRDEAVNLLPYRALL